MATGELTGDLRAAADETLLAEGMQAASATPPPSAGETAEWRIPDPVSDGETPPGSTQTSDVPSTTFRREIEIHRTAETHDAPPEPATEAPAARIVVDDVELPDIVTDEPPKNAFVPEPEDAEHSAKADWFASADGELEWPAFASPRRGRPDEHRELDEEAADRVRYLFPVPDATDWDVGELSYDRRGSS